jgi:hypothetical protein
MRFVHCCCVVCCTVRRAVPLAMALLNVSDPGQQVVDALSRLSHDADTEVGGKLSWGCTQVSVRVVRAQQRKGIDRRCLVSQWQVVWASQGKGPSPQVQTVAAW